MNGSLKIVAEIAGVTLDRTITKTGDKQQSYVVAINAAKAVSSWVKTDANTAAGAFATGHGLVTSDVVDVYWTGGMRYGVVVTMTGDNAAFEGGTGTDFPASATTGITVCKVVPINCAIDGDLTELFAAHCDQRGHLLFEDVADNDIAAFDTVAGEPLVWAADTGLANPLTGAPITECLASTASTAGATLTILALEDSTP